MKEEKISNKLNCAFVGCGNMGRALLEAAFRSRVFHDPIYVVDKNIQCLDAIDKKVNIQKFCRVKDLPFSDIDILFIAVKPQDFMNIASDLRMGLQVNSFLIVSIMAGISIENISSYLQGYKQVVRAMPNLPIVVQKGVVVWYSSFLLNKTNIDILNTVFNNCGISLFVNNEDLIDAATAISGSGPGFIAYMLKYALKAGEKLGFSKKESMDLIYQTLKGTVELLTRQDMSPEELEARVASKGGTTERGIQVFEDKQVGSIIEEALIVAKNRAKQLSK